MTTQLRILSIISVTGYIRASYTGGYMYCMNNGTNTIMVSYLQYMWSRIVVGMVWLTISKYTVGMLQHVAMYHVCVTLYIHIVIYLLCYFSIDYMHHTNYKIYWIEWATVCSQFTSYHILNFLRINTCYFLLCFRKEFLKKIKLISPFNCSSVWYFYVIR